MFESGCSDGECTQLQHAFRRDDISGTTDTFLSLLSLPGVAANPSPFCNGTEFEDKDPIRRDCAGNGQSTGGENVCQRTKGALELTNVGPTTPDWAAASSAIAPGTNQPGDLGLVLPIVMPGALADQYPNSNTCAANGFGGSFKLAPMPFSSLPGSQQLCPNGVPRAFNGCLWPVDAQGNFGCVNPQTNRPAFGTIGFVSRMDGRVYNLTPRRLNGQIPTVPRKLSSTSSTIVQRPLMNVGFYRIHQRTVMANAVAGATCQEDNDTSQIGCLVNASPCSLGFAGLTAGLEPNKALNMRTPRGLATGGAEVAPTPENIRRLLNSCADGGNYDLRFPLSRKLYFNTFVGFDNVSDTLNGAVTKEGQLARCWSDRRFVDRAAAVAGFITLSDNTCAQQALPTDPSQPLNTPTECDLSDDSPATEIVSCAD
jgi:hypothetical protein